MTGDGANDLGMIEAAGLGVAYHAKPAVAAAAAARIDYGDLTALRYDNWKIVFQEQRSEGFDVWQDPFTPLRVPKIFNLRADPFESGDTLAMNYGQWRIDRVFLLVPAQGFVAHWIQSFKEFPPSQTPASFSIDQVMKKLAEGAQKNR